MSAAASATPEGVLVPTPEESATAESQRAEAESQRAEAALLEVKTERQRTEAAQQQNEKLMAKLRELGVDPGSISN